MNIELQAIKDKWDETPRDSVGALALSDTYVSNHPEEFDGYADMDLEQLVGALEVFRAAGMDENEWRCQAYLFHKFEPQNIGGTYQPQLRIVGN